MITKGTVIEVNVSELGLVTNTGKVVWGAYQSCRHIRSTFGVTSQHLAVMLAGPTTSYNLHPRALLLRRRLLLPCIVQENTPRSLTIRRTMVASSKPQPFFRRLVGRATRKSSLYSLVAPCYGAVPCCLFDRHRSESTIRLYSLNTEYILGTGGVATHTMMYTCTLVNETPTPVSRCRRQKLQTLRRH